MNQFVQAVGISLVLLMGVVGSASAIPDGANPMQTYLQTLQQARDKTRAQAWPQAAALWQQVNIQNPTVGSHWLALAMARFYQGHDTEAIEAFVKTRELGSFPDYLLMEDAWTFPPALLHDFDVASWPWGTDYFLACCYARMGDKTRALESLGHSLKSGLRDRFGLLTDARFASLQQDARFRTLVGVPDTKGMTREEGWRTDVRLLGEEIARLHYAPNQRAAAPELKKQMSRLTKAIPHLSDAEIVVRVMQMLPLLKSGHTTLPWWDSSSHLGGDVGVKFYRFQEGLYITSAARAHRELVGARVVAVGDYPVAHALEVLNTCVSRDNELWPTLIAPILLRKPALVHALKLSASSANLPLTLELASGQRQQVTLSPENGEPHPPTNG